MTSQFLYLRDYLQHLSIPERIEYAQGIGQIWIDLINQSDVFLDERDYNLYSIVKHGDREWLGENFRFNHPDSHLNPDNPDITYGRLYDWDTCMEIAPFEYYLPSIKEIKTRNSSKIYPGYSSKGSNSGLDRWYFEWSSDNYDEHRAYVSCYTPNRDHNKPNGTDNTSLGKLLCFSCRYIKSL